jgi:orotate phosphoribosyltransferase-like protein
MGKMKDMIQEVRELMFAGLDEVEIANRLDLPVDMVEEMFSFIQDMEFNYPYEEVIYGDL